MCKSDQPLEENTFLPGLPMVEDKLAMAHSLETRASFLDNDIVGFAMRIPACLKLGNLMQILELNKSEPVSKTAC